MHAARMHYRVGTTVWMDRADAEIAAAALSLPIIPTVLGADGRWHDA